MPVCTNHPQVEETAPCAACARHFCESCLAEIMGRRLCLECKEQAVQGVSARPRRHPLALISLVVPVVGYATCILWLVPVTSPIGLYLAWRVLRDLRREPHYSGRSLALASLVLSAGTIVTWLLALLVALVARLRPA